MQISASRQTEDYAFSYYRDPLVQVTHCVVAQYLLGQIFFNKDAFGGGKFGTSCRSPTAFSSNLDVFVTIFLTTECSTAAIVRVRGAIKPKDIVMSFKARIQKNGKAVLKQRSSQQATRNSGTSLHQTRPVAIIQRAQLAPRSLTPQDLHHLQSTIGNRAVGRLLSQATQNTGSADSSPVAQRQPGAGARLYHNFGGLRVHGARPDSIQAKWTTGGVNKTLKKDKMGTDAVTDLNAQGYTVLHFDSYKFKRQFYTDKSKTRKDGPPVDYKKNGWHIRSKAEIAVSDERTNDQAASTLVHEVAHANQHKANEEAKLKSEKPSFPDKLAKELDAHIKQEEFNIATGIPPKHKSFRDADDKIDKSAIKKYVERVYAVGSKKRYYTDTKPVYKVLETIKPWPTP